MLEIWKGATNNNKVSGALFTDFSKAFDYLSHDLFIDKLHAKYRRGSLLGPLLINLFRTDIFLILKATYFTGYAICS